ncbi:hypothetical protein AB0H51_21810 [Streptomyces griseoluteus]
MTFTPPTGIEDRPLGRLADPDASLAGNSSSYASADGVSTP